jgi:hypothetical protein
MEALYPTNITRGAPHCIYAIWMIRMMVDKNGWSWMIMQNNG